jgi:methionyl-tRNA synthetase
VAADAVARFKKMTGYETRFLTGTDEHGQKIERAAKAGDKTPLEFVDEVVAGIKHLWGKLEVDYDDFIRTTEGRHKKVVSAIFQKLYDQGDIYKASYEGWYCTPCEAFWAESRLEDGNCPDCGRPVELLQEESYFFKMSKYADRLLKHIEDHPEFILPTSRRNEMVSSLKAAWKTCASHGLLLTGAFLCRSMTARDLRVGGRPYQLYLRPGLRYQ